MIPEEKSSREQKRNYIPWRGSEQEQKCSKEKMGSVDITENQKGTERKVVSSSVSQAQGGEDFLQA